MRLREAIAVATPAAAKAVTVAGLALAASFALLALVPLRSFREFAFVMARRRPARHVRRALAARPGADVAVRRGRVVAGAPAARALRRGRSSSASRAAPGCACDEAQALTEGTLAALGERITPRERRVLARPPAARSCARRSTARARRRRALPRRRVPRARARARRRRATSAGARCADYAAAVLTTLEEAAPDDLAYVRAQLSSDYDALFRGR